jgi:hypothetical protein
VHQGGYELHWPKVSLLDTGRMYERRRKSMTKKWVNNFDGGLQK